MGSSDRAEFGRRTFIAGASTTALFGLYSGSAMGRTFAAGSTSAIGTTQAGKIRGHEDRGVFNFKGVPYGAATDGENRFMAPRPVVPWTGVRDALEWGPTAPQRPIARYQLLESWDAGFDAAPKSEDCLVLNLWTPAIGSSSGRRPVMLYLHGGGFTGRSGSRAVFDGGELARRSDVVVVTINQRLNIFGYMYLGHLDPDFANSGNCGTLDSIAALEWVRDNITEFGGDPGNVTIFGQSGGGQKVSTLLASPPAKGLFHRAIVQSGSYLSAASIEAASIATDGFLKSIEIGPNDLKKLQQMPWQTLADATQRALRTSYSDRHFQPVVDGRTLRGGPWYPDAPGISADIPLMIGTTRTETTLLLGNNDPSAFSLNDAELHRRLAPWLEDGDGDAIIAAFKVANPKATPSELYFLITTTIRMRKLAAAQADQRLGQAGGAPVYMYEIDWTTPVDGGKWGSPHSMDHGFVFHNLQGNDSIYGDAKDVGKIADQMSPAWAAFARSGNPNHAGIPHWPTYDKDTHATMLFDVKSHVENDPRKADLAAVASLPLDPPGGDPLSRALK